MEMTQSSASGRIRRLRWRRSKVFACSVRWVRAFTDGSRSRMVMSGRGYRFCAAVWPLTTPPRRSCGFPIGSSFWPGHLRSQGKWKRGWSCWTMRCRSSKERGSAGWKLSCIGTKGQLLLQQGHSEAAEELYCKALSIALEQEAKLWELRAAASLARLCRDQGRCAEARELLAPVYG